ncbi:hypothetical protein GYMLUDRAFT_76570 [Collybiopsis luxurians FD-317 M1]|uniref:Unplaced genomic scaffold GYMLUscaffold_59, whole genome shotgun sequence n=1 Tax=Collybiopsis luxurians FD-317 M1 TaxID=944289 RepID=A0A0D0CJX3_9AGAR|nr:hypothetical protein GYMLUDRAFT_76570 [Collybiopsis luxurians FD-317 M1]
MEFRTRDQSLGGLRVAYISSRLSCVLITLSRIFHLYCLVQFISGIFWSQTSFLFPSSFRATSSFKPSFAFNFRQTSFDPLHAESHFATASATPGAVDIWSWQSR